MGPTRLPPTPEEEEPPPTLISRSEPKASEPSSPAACDTNSSSSEQVRSHVKLYSPGRRAFAWRPAPGGLARDDRRLLTDRSR
ncbi:hypothetical protein EVAR_21541_1 [Eumeta japonica]|uniref:Uncharacterized protein n=1 Tax=Eumeta variegata TaxID=151549 RepID=A0A4C1UYE7_EUMVA|nr:hypothetical protein EVAR_21541_1 [Eumeta japonica]